MALTVRAATAADQPSVLAACATALEFDGEDAVRYPEVLTRRADHRHLVAVDGDTVIGTAFGSVREIEGEPVGQLDLIAVAPAAQGRGAGHALLGSMEEALRVAGCGELRAVGHPPHFAWPGIDVRYTRALCLVESHGYERYRTGEHMLVDLRTAPLDTADDERRLAAAGISVRRLTTDDVPGIRPWLDSWGGTWTAEALGTLANDPVSCHVAVGPDGGYLGFAAHGVNTPGMFGPMGTDAATRGQGVGGVLLKRCLADQRAAGLARAEIGWVGPHRFYARAVDARIDRVFWMYRKNL
jgi:mycothiol synthase